MLATGNSVRALREPRHKPEKPASTRVQAFRSSGKACLAMSDGTLRSCSDQKQSTMAPVKPVERQFRARDCKGCGARWFNGCLLEKRSIGFFSGAANRLATLARAGGSVVRSVAGTATGLAALAMVSRSNGRFGGSGAP